MCFIKMFILVVQVNLLENIKISTSRDFRIISKTVDTVVEQGASSDDSDGQDEEEIIAEKVIFFY